MSNYRFPTLPYLTVYLGISWFLIFSSLVWFGLVRCLLLFARIASDVMPRERFVDRSIWLVVGTTS